MTLFNYLEKEPGDRILEYRLEYIVLLYMQSVLGESVDSSMRVCPITRVYWIVSMTKFITGDSKTCVKRTLSKYHNWFSFNGGQTHDRVFLY